MRAKEFLTEEENLLYSVHDTLPSTYILPQLKNNDFYLQYRFGVAIAGAKGKKERSKHDVPLYKKESEWGENQVVSSMDPNLGIYIDDALEQMGMSGKKAVGDTKSRENKKINVSSPIKPFKGYGK